MSHDKVKALVDVLMVRHGTLAYPKGDGRVEVPRALVRLMDWKDKQAITIACGDGFLNLSDRPRVGEHIIGQVTISMERARIPMSMLRAAGMTGYRTVVISASLTPPSLSVQPWIVNRQDELRQIIEDAGSEIRDRLYAILVDQRAVPAQPQVAEPLPDPVVEPVEPYADPLPEPALDKAQLFLPEFSMPNIIRIVGSPFAFQSHWVAKGCEGTIVPHRQSGCPCCGVRAPDRTYLVPVIKRKEDQFTAGYLLVRDELRTKIGRVLAGANPTLFDLILYYKPFVDGMFDVYKNPPEPMPEGIVERAQAACGDPDVFLANTFPEQESFAPPSRMPALLALGHFAGSIKPHNFGK